MATIAAAALTTAGTPTLPLLALVIIALPLIEIAGFALVGSMVGVLPTVALVVATTVLGAILLRVQGLGVLGRIREAMEKGDTAGRELVHGLMIAIAGLLLVIPGFFTDILGLLLFIPPLRELVWRFLRSRVVVVGAGYGPGETGFSRDGNRTIDLDSEDFSRQDQEPRRRLRRDDD